MDTKEECSQLISSEAETVVGAVGACRACLSDSVDLGSPHVAANSVVADQGLERAIR